MDSSSRSLPQLNIGKHAIMVGWPYDPSLQDMVWRIENHLTGANPASYVGP